MSPQSDRLPASGRLSEAFPLTPGQRSLWFMQQILPESAVYHIALAVRILSPLDVPALQSALQAIFDRHDSLRTVLFINTRGELAQKVNVRSPVAFEVIDTTGFSRDETDAAVTAAFRNTFDLAAGPLFRSHLFTDDAENRLLLITAHHLVFDALSLLRVFHELLEIYSSARSGGGPPLIPVKATYRDFVEWQMQMLAGSEGEAHLEFWRQELQGAPPVLDLPTDHQRLLHPGGRGGELWFPIPARLVDDLRALAGKLDIQLFAIFAAAWQVLLYRYSGQSDIVIGFVTGGRPHLRYARTIGSFSNTIVLRAQMEGDPPAEQFLRRQHERLATCLAHQDYPFPLVVEKLRVSRVPGYMPLVQVLFTYFTARGSQTSEIFVRGHEPAIVQSDAFAMESHGLKQEDVEFDLALTVVEGKRCWGRLRYDKDLFDAATVERLTGHYVNLLQGIIAAPSRTVSSIPLLGEAEREEILFDGNRPQGQRPASTACHLFELQVAATPDRIAVVCGEQQLTYAALNARADSLSAYLQDKGAVRESLVAVCMERSVDMLVALLAIWKAGAAYVPLDPYFPKARLRLILEDAAPCMIVTEAKLVDLVMPCACPAIELDTQEIQASEARAAESAPPASGSHLAYVLYTSGSTGSPKGVEIAHSALTNFLLSMRRRPGLNSDDVLLAVTTLAFDIAGLELFLPLMAGARVVIATREAALDGTALAAEIERHQATVMQATPSTWRLLIDSNWLGSPRLKALCGGEALPRQLARDLLPRVSSLWNMYGPTETTIWSAVHQVRPNDDPIPLGSAIDNTTLYILDANLEPVPIGVAGELHIGGAGLARGYRKHRYLTASRFIGNPFLPGERLYKTGDLCRFRDGGAIQFLGRMDDQVKLRGHRIELGEIESVLLRHRAVRQAAVVVSEEHPAKRLIACLVAHVGVPRALPAELRQSLSTYLPEYMIPSAFVYLESLPLTPNSKVDRKVLCSLAVAASAGERGYVAPRTATETAVAALWAELLKIARPVGAHDHFIELGGDSLLFALMTIRAGNRLGYKIPVRMDSDIMTVAGFARAADLIASPQGSVLAASSDLRLEPLRKTWYGQVLVKACALIVRSIARIEVDGLENAPVRGPAIVASNHISLFDMAILGSVLATMKDRVPVIPTFVIFDKWRWLAQPYVSQLGNTIYVRRGEGDSEALEAAKQVLANNGVVAITPEGRPTRGALTRGKPGIAYLAREAGVHIWPLAIFGHDRIFGCLKRRRRVPVRVRLGERLFLSDNDLGGDDFQRHADSVMRAIAALMPPEYHGAYFGTVPGTQ